MLLPTILRSISFERHKSLQAGMSNNEFVAERYREQLLEALYSLRGLREILPLHKTVLKYVVLILCDRQEFLCLCAHVHFKDQCIGKIPFNIKFLSSTHTYKNNTAIYVILFEVLYLEINI